MNTSRILQTENCSNDRPPRYFPWLNFSDFATNELNTDYSPFSRIHLRVVFEALLIGQVFNTLVFLVELLYYRACTNASTSTKM